MKRRAKLPDPWLDERLARREEARKRLAGVMSRADLPPYDRRELEDANRVADFLAKKPFVDPSRVYRTGIGALRSIRRAFLIGDLILENPDDFGIDVHPYEGDARVLAATLRLCKVKTRKEAEEIARTNFGARARITLDFVLANRDTYNIEI